jgi:hypothetical protein
VLHTDPLKPPFQRGVGGINLTYARGIKLSENSSKFIILKSDGSEIPIEIENSDSKKLFKKILTELENKIDKKTEQGNNM